MTDKITLYCLVHGESVENVFHIDIEKDLRICHIKKAIKEEKSNDFRDVDCNNLKLWKVNIPSCNADALEQLDLEGYEKLQPLSKILDVFPEDFLDELNELIHIIIEHRPA